MATTGAGWGGVGVMTDDDWAKIQDAATQHLQTSGHRGFTITRMLDGLAVGVECAMCVESWWRTGFEQLASKISDGVSR